MSGFPKVCPLYVLFFYVLQIPYLFCLHSIIVKLKQHEEFFPAFHALTVDILETLGKLLEHSNSLNHLNALDILILLY